MENLSVDVFVSDGLSDKQFARNVAGVTIFNELQNEPYLVVMTRNRLRLSKESSAPVYYIEILQTTKKNIKSVFRNSTDMPFMAERQLDKYDVMRFKETLDRDYILREKTEDGKIYELKNGEFKQAYDLIRKKRKFNSLLRAFRFTISLPSADTLLYFNKDLITAIVDTKKFYDLNKLKSYELDAMVEFYGILKQIKNKFTVNNLGGLINKKKLTAFINENKY